MEKNLVSVLIVTYNAEKYIKKTLLSCLNQTYANIEFLMLDNASRDKTLKIVKEIQKKDDRLKIFKSDTNLGPFAGLNFLIDKARGKYIAIQDHDDIWFPEKIEKQVEFLENNEDFIACGTETFYFYENKEVLIADKKEGVVDFVDHTSLVFRNIGLRYDAKYVLADEYFEKKILKSKGYIYCMGEPLTIHRIRFDRNNFSRIRFSLNSKNIKEFFEINGLSRSSLIYLLSIFTMKYLPDKMVWKIINFVKRNSKKISTTDFNSTFKINL